jgi:hypothetical protein
LRGKDGGVRISKSNIKTTDKKYFDYYMGF